MNGWREQLLDVIGWHRSESARSEKQVQIRVTPNDGLLDPYSGTWVHIAGWAQSELAKARERNDLVTNDEASTAALRGRIKLLKELLSLPNPPKERKKQEIFSEDAGYGY